MMEGTTAYELADYRRRVHELYAMVRSSKSLEAAWIGWQQERDVLFKTHPSSALDEEQQWQFARLSYFAYDPQYRFSARLEPAPGPLVTIRHSSEGTTHFVPVGRVSLRDIGIDESLTVYWLDAYGGGMFLPFRDATAGDTTYGGGRYLLDTVKGADLGRAGNDRVIIDFNYSYHPSGVYSPRWSCPLAPPENRLQAAIPVGERLP